MAHSRFASKYGYKVARLYSIIERYLCVICALLKVFNRGDSKDCIPVALSGESFYRYENLPTRRVNWIGSHTNRSEFLCIKKKMRRVEFMGSLSSRRKG